MTSVDFYIDINLKSSWIHTIPQKFGVTEKKKGKLGNLGLWTLGSSLSSMLSWCFGHDFPLLESQILANSILKIILVIFYLNTVLCRHNTLDKWILNLWLFSFEIPPIENLANFLYLNTLTSLLNILILFFRNWLLPFLFHNLLQIILANF